MYCCNLLSIYTVFNGSFTAEFNAIDLISSSSAQDLCLQLEPDTNKAIPNLVSPQK